jgi:hypothetical protein
MALKKLIQSSLVRILILLAVGAGVFFTGCGGTGSDSTDSADSDTNGDEAPPSGTLFYIDPIHGDPANDGSADHPWRTLAEVLEAGLIQTQAYADLPYTGDNPLEIKNPGAPVTAGDTLVLLSGFHGAVELRGAYNESTITIQAAEGHTPTLSAISLTSVSNWHLKGLSVSPSTAPTYEKQTLFSVVSHGWHGPSHHITIEDCRLYSVEDSEGWDADDWNDLAASCISMNGDHMTARGNLCRNIDFGITISGNYGAVVANTIENFAGDGMRGLGNDLLFESNLVKNCYDVNANHDDGFQSWSINDDPPRERVTLRANTIINFEGADYLLRGSLQGIGCFDGPYIDWVVENNLVITDHWHGISLYGAVNSRIVNNTVVDADDDPESPGPPWIMFHDHKDGTPSSGCLIRNNIAATISTSGDTVADHNYRLEEGDTLFQDPADFDYHLRADAGAVIDAGSADQAPTTDKDGTPRPQGAGIDLGCYEY